MRSAVVMCLAIALFSGCVAVKEADKVLVDQTKKGGRKIQEDGAKVAGIGISLQASPDPAVAAQGKELEATGKDLQETGKVIELNSGQVQEVVGTPKAENQKTFSPATSDDARKESAEKHANPWWKVAGVWLAGLVLGGGGLKALQYFFPTIFSGPWGVAAKALMEGIARVRQMAATREDGKVRMDEVLAELKRIQQDEGVQTLIRDAAHKIEEKVVGNKL